MTVQTTTPLGNHHADPDYYRGRADAYDHSQDRTVDQMTALMGMAIDYGSLPYAHGYADRVNELRRELAVVAAAESELAQTWLTRKQGRETSTLHQRHRTHR